MSILFSVVSVLWWIVAGAQIATDEPAEMASLIAIISLIGSVVTQRLDAICRCIRA